MASSSSKDYAYQEIPPPYQAAAEPAYVVNGQPVYSGGTAYQVLPEDGDFAAHITVVAEADQSIRLAFLRKVYLILGLQLGLTAGICALFVSVTSIRDWVQDNYWMVWVMLIPTILLMVAAMVKRRQSPINLILLMLFTLFESYWIGTIVAFYSGDDGGLEIVYIAFGATMAIFLGLTLFTLQTRIDFSGAAPYVRRDWHSLFVALLVLLIMTFVGIFVENTVFEIVLSSIGIFIFSALIVFDTSMMLKRLSPEEYICAALELYLDIINLFLWMLRLVSAARD